MFSAELPSIGCFVRVNHKANGPGGVATCDCCLLSFRQRRTGICCFGNDKRKAQLNPQISSNSFNNHSPPRGCSHGIFVRDKVLSTAVPTIQQPVGRAPCRLQGLSLQTLECRHCSATYYYLISKHFSPGISTPLVKSAAYLQSPLASSKCVCTCILTKPLLTYSTNSCTFHPGELLYLVTPSHPYRKLLVTCLLSITIFFSAFHYKLLHFQKYSFAGKEEEKSACPG